MTAPANRPPDDHLEERLAAAFDRATMQAQADLADGRKLADVLDHGRRRRGAPFGRSGLLVLAVAALGVGMVWAIGSRPAPRPTPSVPIAGNASASPALTANPTGETTSQAPVESFGSQTPVVPGGATLPPTVGGQAVYAVGGPAEEKIAASTDATPFYISGWYLPLHRQACVEQMPSLAPNGVSFAECARVPLFAAADGGASVKLFFSMTDQQFDWAALHVPSAYVHQVVLRVHTHDPSCTGATCAAPVMDQVAAVRDAVLNPALVAGTPPPNAAPLAKAVANGYDYAKNAVVAIGATPVLLSAEFGTVAVLGDLSVQTDPLTTWEWKLVFASSDGVQRITIWEDVTGVSDHYESQSGGLVAGS